MAEELYVLVRSHEVPNGSKEVLQSTPEADRFGRVLFRTDAVQPQGVDSDLFKGRLSNAIKTVHDSVKAAGLSSAEVTLKFAADAKVGVVFLGETGLEASIEVKFTFDLKD
jgi:hypothetical protein